MEEEREKRVKLVAIAIALTEHTPLAPGRYERQLLAQYIDGYLTIEQVQHLLEQEP